MTQKQVQIAIFLSLVVLISAISVSADAEEFAQAELLISQKIPCSNLTDSQLEAIGDYLMEQMHPGEQHEIMDARMGGEGSESLRQVHISLAKTFYCGENASMHGAMMTKMFGSGKVGRMGDYKNSVMGKVRTTDSANKMMFSNRHFGLYSANPILSGLLWLACFAIGSFVFGLIFWWTKNLVPERKKHK